jgi:membrane-bound lytic murein transglycosylase B
MKIIQRLRPVAMIVAGLVLAVGVAAGDYAKHPQAQAFVERMVKEHGFDRVMLQSVLAKAEKKDAILEAIARPAEKSKPWFKYRKIFLDASRIELGVKFWQENEAVLSAVAEQYSVDPAIIVAIIGVETRYGGYMGNYRVLDALATLGFDYPPRGAFFAGELEHFFLLAREQKRDPLVLTGSYAGAMGYGQFIPSSYRNYARDFDGDGFADIWTNKQDAIASVGNYFKAHGWKKGEPVVARVRLTKSLPAVEMNIKDRPSISVKTWRKKGVVSKTKMNSQLPAVVLEYDQIDHKEHWLGFNNFYSVGRG